MEGSVGRPETVDPLAGVISVTEATLGGVSNVVEALVRRRRLWEDEVEGAIAILPRNNER